MFAEHQNARHWALEVGHPNHNDEYKANDKRGALAQRQGSGDFLDSYSITSFQKAYRLRQENSSIVPNTLAYIGQ